MAKARKPVPRVALEEALAWLQAEASEDVRLGMTRFGIPNTRAWGVRMGTMQQIAKRIGKDHELAAALWTRDWYEPRTLAALVDDPGQVTPEQMDAWAADFDSWAICDTACFHLFARAPHAWAKAHEWAPAEAEFVRRAAFALMASLVLRDKAAPDERFLALFPLMEQGARDDRNFVKKAVSWALRSIGKRNADLHRAALDLAERLAEAPEAALRWVGKEARRELAGAKLRERMAARTG